ncbi:hypothetical protein [Rubritalea sp.]|uniref:hypothetical protein n=1 Tax=Rubritalea sp. TaxID=2109375 RepID=UPI003242EEC5
MEYTEGMAPMDLLTSHDWHFNFAEMANEAAFSVESVASITQSIHSYDDLAGWAYANFLRITA